MQCQLEQSYQTTKGSEWKMCKSPSIAVIRYLFYLSAICHESETIGRKRSESPIGFECMISWV